MIRNIFAIGILVILIGASLLMIGETSLDPTGHLELERRLSKMEQRVDSMDGYLTELKHADLRVRTAKLELQFVEVERLLRWVLGVGASVLISIWVKTYMDNRNFRHIRANQHRTVNFLTSVVGEGELASPSSRRSNGEL